MLHLQDKLGLDYDDPVAVNAEIPQGWWLKDDSCKYILSVLVHKDNKDISTRPTKLPPGPTRASVREMAQLSTMKDRAAGKEQRLVSTTSIQRRDESLHIERDGDVEYQSKKAKVEGMRSVIDKNRVDAIMTQITVMRGLEEVYVNRLGRDEYERQLVHLANQMPGMIAVQAPRGDLVIPQSDTHGDEDIHTEQQDG
jgi:hypothetical protein